MVPDLDGVRLLTNDSCEFMHKVPGRGHAIPFDREKLELTWK